jgi:hypothetical protein
MVIKAFYIAFWTMLVIVALSRLARRKACGVGSPQSLRFKGTVDTKYCL